MANRLRSIVQNNRGCRPAAVLPPDVIVYACQDHDTSLVDEEPVLIETELPVSSKTRCSQLIFNRKALFTMLIFVSGIGIGVYIRILYERL